MDDSGARAIPGVTVVRDGTFVGVVAPTERLGAQSGSGNQSRVAHPAGPSLVATGLRAPEEDWRRRRRRTRRNANCRGRCRRPARAAAARTFDASYRIPYIAHVPLEPRCAVAEWSDGKLTVWTGTQRPFGVRTELAAAFRIPEDAGARDRARTRARRTAASTPASTRSKRRGWRRPRASRSSWSGRATRSSGSATSGRPASSR